MNITITLPDGSQKQYDAPVTPRQVAEDIGPGLAKAALGAKIDGELVDLSHPIGTDAALAIVTAGRGKTDPDALFLIRHSAAHVMAEAIQNLWPDTKLAYGPPVDSGFYYDIDCPHAITEEDFPAIEAEMKKIVDADRPFTRCEMTRDEAMGKMADDEYKTDNIERAKGDTLSFYASGQPGEAWEDLCRGPHVPSTGRIGAFKLMSVAGAYWHGDATKQQLQRVYGTTFTDKKLLKAHIKALEEARKRDHRVIGKQMGLFLLTPEVGSGLPLWMPKGAILRGELMRFLEEELFLRGYQPVVTPHIGNIELFKTSGHYPYYSDSQFPPIQMREDEDEQYLLKPMNCPHHIQIYKAEPHSYRDLPLRLAEFGTVYRFEQSGELNGLTRVRGFTQDDAHIFCTPDQLKEEFRSTIELVQLIFKTFGFKDVNIDLSLRDPASDKYVGDSATWDRAEADLRNVLDSMDFDYQTDVGGAAFYGPKVDFKVKDVIGRSWQLGTVQLDYNLPSRFEIEYIGADNQPHTPVMIHRAPFGSLERFIGILIEHYAGNFPLWLAPTQVAVLPISDNQLDYAKQVQSRLREVGLRAELDITSEKIGKKIRNAEIGKTPVMFVIGGKEAEAGQVALRRRGLGDLGTLALDEAITQLKTEIAERRNLPTKDEG